MATKVLCVGAAVLDTLYRVHDLPKGEGKILPWDMLQVAEGMASSAAFAIRRLGGSASLWSAVGDDPDGSRIRAELAAAGLDLSGTRTVAGARSAQCTILIDDQGERLIVVFYDPKLHAAPRPVDQGEIAGFDAVLVDVRWPDLAAEVLRSARSQGIPAILDGDTAPTPVLERLGAEASDIVFSEPAALALAGTAELAPMFAALATRFPLARFCVTFGARGCWWPEAGRLRHQPALPVTAVDTLAAGDAFHGAFALAIGQGQSLEQAIRLGSVTAALKCRVFGGRLGMPDLAAATQALDLLPPAV